jgi:FkbM family methyltransferase
MDRETAALQKVADFPSKEVVLGGHVFKIHGIAPDDQYFASIHSNYESEFCELASRLIPPDYICLDVGANIGIKSLFLSRHCPLGRVVAIEPAPIVARCLEVNVAANRAANILIEQTVIGDMVGTVRFEVASAWSHVSESGVEVPSVTLEAIVERLALPRVDFVKIDVEGYELPAMRSSLDMFNRFESLVLVELNALTQLCVTNTNPRDFIDWILDNFTHVFAVRKGASDGNLLEPIGKKEGIALLFRNMVRDGCATDLLITNSERRLAATSAHLEQRLKASESRYSDLGAELSAAKAELSAAKSELDSMHSRLESLQKSASWSVTAPLRWLRDILPIRK